MDSYIYSHTFKRNHDIASFFLYCDSRIVKLISKVSDGLLLKQCQKETFTKFRFLFDQFTKVDKHLTGRNNNKLCSVSWLTGIIDMAGLTFSSNEHVFPL